MIAIIGSMMISVAFAAFTGDATRIKDGILTYSTGHYLEDKPIPLGFDDYGYNYQAHLFNSYYPNAYLGRDGYPPFEGDLEAYNQRLIDEGYIIQGKNYDDVTLSDWQSKNTPDTWDLTKSDLVLKYTIDMSEMLTPGWVPVEVGLRQEGGPNLDPNYIGGWLQSMFKSAADNPSADLNDYHVLMKHGWLDEYYDYTTTGSMANTAPWTYINYAFYFDRGAVDEFQETYWNYKDEVTYNTKGVYEIEITYQALTSSLATMFVKINGEDQGFYTTGYDSANPPNLIPVGRTFTGDMTKMQVFYGRGSGGGTVELTDISVQYSFENTPYNKWYWYPEDQLAMKWNDAWLSNLDRDLDGALDRHWGFDSYIGSGAWLTNHQSGEYELDGKMIKWNYFTKIVAAPADATSIDGVWYAADGTEIGPAIWGEFAIIQIVENDPGIDAHGLQYVSPLSAGLGAYAP